jgi:hypothetical protein
MAAHQIAVAQEEAPAVAVLAVEVGIPMVLVQERLGKDLMAGNQEPLIRMVAVVVEQAQLVEHLTTVQIHVKAETGFNLL